MSSYNRLNSLIGGRPIKSIRNRYKLWRGYNWVQRLLGVCDHEKGIRFNFSMFQFNVNIGSSGLSIKILVKMWRAEYAVDERALQGRDPCPALMHHSWFPRLGSCNMLSIDLINMVKSYRYYNWVQRDILSSNCRILLNQQKMEAQQ